jgi:hypothetical protein
MNALMSSIRTQPSPRALFALALIAGLLVIQFVLGGCKTTKVEEPRATTTYDTARTYDNRTYDGRTYYDTYDWRGQNDTARSYTGAGHVDPAHSYTGEESRYDQGRYGETGWRYDEAGRRYAPAREVGVVDEMYDRSYNRTYKPSRQPDR